MKKVSVFLDDEVHYQMKLHCVEDGIYIQEFVLGAITSALKPPPAPQNESLSQIKLPLTRRDKRKYVRMAGDILRSGDPLAVNLLKATVAFYGAHLNEAGHQHQV